MSRDLRHERGGVMVIAALTIPVFLLMAALVVDVGNWYTHKRQLQNRADAAALAAGVEYGRQIYRCLSTTPSDVTTAETELSQAARAYAGDPTYAPAAGGGPDSLPDPQISNTEIAKQSNVDVFLNSVSYSGPTNSDGGGGCYQHLTADDVSTPPPGQWLQWMDVKVKEKNTASLFGGFGLDLLQNTARARVELHPAEELGGFLPIGIPDNRIAKARARFINECTGGQLGSLITLKPLAAAYQSISGNTLWGPDDGLGAATTTPVPVSFTMPSGLTGCPAELDHVPISVEVRAAGRSGINLDPPVTCGSLQLKPQAECWENVGYVRAWATEGDPGGPLSGDTVLVEDVTLSGAGSEPCSQDPYYARVDAGDTSCTADASVYLDWDRRYSLDPAKSTYEADLEIDGDNFTLTGPSDGAPGTWVATGITVPLDPQEVKVNWHWRYRLTGHEDCPLEACEQSGTIVVHYVHATEEASKYDALTTVKLTSGPAVGEQHTVKLTDPSSGGTQNYTGYLRVGLKSTLTIGQWAVLRLRSPQSNYSLVCDPRFDQPSTPDMEAAFYFGCKPPYAKNHFDDADWWNDFDGDGEEECPAGQGAGGWLTGPPYPNSPWKCVHADNGGNGFGVTDGIALRTGNCRNPAIDKAALTAQCTGHNYQCNNDIDVPGPGDTVDINDPRVVRIYILPFNAFNNVATGANTDLPVLDFAMFYVTAWKYQTAVDPCPSAENNRLSNFPGVANKPAQLGGYFIKWVDGNSGAIDPNATCTLDSLTPCRAVLVR
jgi:Putative Flp pilus-assembly TadE/G-like